MERGRPYAFKRNFKSVRQNPLRVVSGIDMQKAIETCPSKREAQRARIVFCLSPTAIMTATLLFLSSSMLQDPDNWWHVKVGLDILANRAFPTTDTYSYTFAGHPWIAKEWLGQVLLALAHQAGGWNGVALLTIAAIALTIFLLCWYFSGDLRPTVAIGLCLIISFYLSQLYNARPFIFTFPIIVIWTAELFRASRNEQAPPLWLLALLVLWANLHAAFTFAFVIAFFAFLDLFERVRLSKRSLLVKWILFGVACPIVTLLNPYGVDAILATFTVALGNEAVPHITEWRPFNAREMYVNEAGLLIILLGLMVSRLRLGWAKSIFFLLALHLFLNHIRLVYLLLLLVPLVVAVDVAAQYPILSARKWLKTQRDGLERFFAARFHWIVGGVAVSMALGVAIFMGLAKVEPSPKTFVKGALAFAQQHDLSGNVLNSYNLGGTLIFHGIKTFIDGRTDQLFLEGFMSRDAETATTGGKPILRKQLEDYAITWALLDTQDVRIPFFDELEGWRREYKDEYAIIYVREDSLQRP